MPAPRPRGRLAALSALAFATLVLTGCAANPVQDLVDRTVEETVEGATGGEVELGGDLPTGFPTSVPVIDGTIEVAGGAGGNSHGWMVVLTPEGADPVADATSALTAAGFTEDASLSGDAAGGSVYTDGQYVVVLAGDATTVTYTVFPAP